MALGQALCCPSMQRRIGIGKSYSIAKNFVLSEALLVIDSDCVNPPHLRVQELP